MYPKLRRVFACNESQQRKSVNKWIEAQEIGIALYAVHTFPQTSHYFLSACEILHQFVLERVPETSSARQLVIARLPPFVLNLLFGLTKLSKERLCLMLGDDLGNAIHTLTPDIRAGINNLYEAPAGSILGRAQIWAYHALIGYCSGKLMVRLWRDLFAHGKSPRKKWREVESDAKIVEDLANQFSILRAPCESTQDRCNAVSMIAKLLGTTNSASWAQVENIIYHHQFCWPLLVIRSHNNGEVSSDDSDLSGDFAVSLPVAADIKFDGRGQVYVTGLDGPILIDGWKRRLKRCLRVANGMWLATHRSQKRSAQDVWNPSISFDFTCAQEVARDCVQTGGASIPVSDGSADAYFAQVILNRILGRSAILASAVTGLIGEQHVKNGRAIQNWDFDPPGGLPHKLAYAFACRSFERIVMPRGTEARVYAFLKTNRVRQSAEIRYAKNMWDLADNVHVRGWRPHEYLRCPELTWAIDRTLDGKPGGLLGATNKDVDAVLQVLKVNISTVLRLNASPSAVLSALWHINMLREAMRPVSPPWLSWAFIRPLENELDSRFWELLWRIIGGSSEELQTFIQQPKIASAVDTLEYVLNRFDARPESPGCCAPDIIVIVGWHLFEDDWKRSLNPLSRPFMVTPIMEKLSNSRRLLIPYDKRLIPLVGKTRIILLPGDESPEQDREISISNLSQTEIDCLNALSAFRWGFTEQTATLLLSEVGSHGVHDVRTMILRPLLKTCALRYSQGSYHIPGPLLKEIVIREEPRKIASRHYSAGVALAPYTVGKEFPSLALDVALSPEHVHEAEWHFNRARSHALRSGQRGIFNASLTAIQHITRFAQAPSWGAVRHFLDVAHLSLDAYEMATELLEWQRTAGYIHPIHLITGGRAAAKWAMNSGNTEQRQKILLEADAYYQNALERCALFPTEESYNRVLCLTFYAVHLSEYVPHRAEEIDKLVEQAVSTIRNVNEVVRKKICEHIWGQWFELAGDREPDPAMALSRYRLGIEVGIKWIEVWAKALGAARLAGLQNEVDFIRGVLAEDAAADLLSVLAFKPIHQRQLKSSILYVPPRWLMGLQVFGELYGTNAKVRYALDRLAREHIGDHQREPNVPQARA